MLFVALRVCGWLGNGRDAHVALQAELAALRNDLAPSMLQQPLSLEDTAEVYIRPQLRQKFIELCTCAITSLKPDRTWELALIAC